MPNFSSLAGLEVAEKFVVGGWAGGWGGFQVALSGWSSECKCQISTL